MSRKNISSAAANYATASSEQLRSCPPAVRQQHIVACVCSNGRGSVSASLNSLLAQEIVTPDVTLSIILVDNTPDGALMILPPFSAPPSKVKYVHEGRPGIPFARNAALMTAKEMDADYIAFLDDDEIAPNSWIETLYSVITASGADVVQGSLRRFPSLDAAITASKAYKSSQGSVRLRRTAATNNVLFKSWLITKDPKLSFDAALARVGGSDTEFFMRACDAGAKIVRASDPPVFEVWNEDREMGAYAARRAWRCGASANYRYRKNRSGVTAASVLTARAMWRAINGLLCCARGAVIYPFSRTSGASAIRKGASGMSFAAGCLSPYFFIGPKTYY